MLFRKISINPGLWFFSVFPRCQCVYTHQAGRTPALQQNWQSSEISQHFKEKTQYLMNTLYHEPHCSFPLSSIYFSSPSVSISSDGSLFSRPLFILSPSPLSTYLPSVCTHTDTEGKQRKARVRKIY